MCDISCLHYKWLFVSGWIDGLLLHNVSGSKVFLRVVSRVFVSMCLIVMLALVDGISSCSDSIFPWACIQAYRAQKKDPRNINRKNIALALYMRSLSVTTVILLLSFALMFETDNHNYLQKLTKVVKDIFAEAHVVSHIINGRSYEHDHLFWVSSYQQFKTGFPPHDLFRHWYWYSRTQVQNNPHGSILYRRPPLAYLNALKVSITAIAKIWL